MSDASSPRRLPWSEIRPALVALLIVGGGWWFLSSRMPAPGTRLEFRDEGPLRVSEPLANAEGATLTWSAVPGAEAYRLVFLGREMQELARVELDADTALALRRDALPQGLVPGTQAFLEVTALRQGATLARSRGRTIQLP